MNHLCGLVAAAIFLIASEASAKPPVDQAAASADAFAQEISRITASVIADSIPRQYERSKDWGKTKRITTGLRSSGNFLDFDIHRRQRDVKHGIWKKYRVTLIQPEKTLSVQIENLRTVGPAQVALTLLVKAKMHGWGRAKVYDRGIHIIALEAEADAAINLRLDAEVSLASVRTTSGLPGLAVRPVVTDSRLVFDDFRLTRVSNLHGTIAKELGAGIHRLIKDEVSGPRLTAKLNRAIEKRSDRLQLSADKWLER